MKKLKEIILGINFIPGFPISKALIFAPPRNDLYMSGEDRKSKAILGFKNFSQEVIAVKK